MMRGAEKWKPGEKRKAREKLRLAQSGGIELFSALLQRNGTLEEEVEDLEGVPTARHQITIVNGTSRPFKIVGTSKPSSPEVLYYALSRDNTWNWNATFRNPTIVGVENVETTVSHLRKLTPPHTSPHNITLRSFIYPNEDSDVSNPGPRFELSTKCSFPQTGSGE